MHRTSGGEAASVFGTNHHLHTVKNQISCAQVLEEVRRVPFRQQAHRMNCWPAPDCIGTSIIRAVLAAQESHIGLSRFNQAVKKSCHVEESFSRNMIENVGSKQVKNSSVSPKKLHCGFSLNPVYATTLTSNPPQRHFVAELFDGHSRYGTILLIENFASPSKSTDVRMSPFHYKKTRFRGRLPRK